MKIMKEDNNQDYVEDISEIHQAIEKELKKIAVSPEFGFTEKEFKDYFRVDTFLPNEDGLARIEIGAEVSYEGLMDICDKLNNIVEKYDSNAYFEPVDPGIAECWIDISNL